MDPLWPNKYVYKEVLQKEAIAKMKNSAYSSVTNEYYGVLNQIKQFPAADSFKGGFDTVNENGQNTDYIGQALKVKGYLTQLFGSTSAEIIMTKLKQQNEDVGKANIYFINQGWVGAESYIRKLYKRNAAPQTIYAALLRWLKHSYGDDYVQQAKNQWNQVGAGVNSDAASVPAASVVNNVTSAEVNTDVDAPGAGGGDETVTEGTQGEVQAEIPPPPTYAPAPPPNTTVQERGELQNMQKEEQLTRHGELTRKRQNKEMESMQQEENTTRKYNKDKHQHNLQQEEHTLNYEFERDVRARKAFAEGNAYTKQFIASLPAEYANLSPESKNIIPARNYFDYAYEWTNEARVLFNNAVEKIYANLEGRKASAREALAAQTEAASVFHEFLSKINRWKEKYIEAGGPALLMKLKKVNSKAERIKLYRALSLLLHPDKTKTIASTELFQEVNLANDNAKLREEGAPVATEPEKGPAPPPPRQESPQQSTSHGQTHTQYGQYHYGTAPADEPNIYSYGEPEPQNEPEPEPELRRSKRSPVPPLQYDPIRGTSFYQIQIPHVKGKHYKSEVRTLYATYNPRTNTSTIPIWDFQQKRVVGHHSFIGRGIRRKGAKMSSVKLKRAIRAGEIRAGNNNPYIRR